MTSNRGFTLIEVLAGALILSVALAISISYLQLNFSSRFNFGLVNEAQSIRVLVNDALQNDLSWYQTVQAATNTTMQCLKNGTDCRSAGGAFALYDSAGNLIFDSTLATNGYTAEGVPCSTFNSTSGNSACPIRVSLNWQPACPAGPGACLNPPATVTAKFTLSMDNSAPLTLNMNRLNLNVLRPRVYCAAQITPIPLATHRELSLSPPLR